MKKFLKSSELQTINGGYLVSKDETPVTNEAFVAAQKRAEFIVTVAEVAKGKNFKSVAAASITDLYKEVTEKLATGKASYIEKPKAPSTKTIDLLSKEALNFMEHTEAVEEADAVNDFLQEFNVIAEFEEFGLFFDEGIVKLNKIYTMDEVIEAVKSCINIIVK